MAVVIPSTLVPAVAAFLGQTGVPSFTAQATEHVGVIAEMVSEYTRGRGFVAGVPSGSLQKVIITASARLLANPEQLQYQTGTVTIRGAFDGWSPLETTILSSYRKRAA